MVSQRERFGWYLARAEKGDGEAMIEVAERLERGVGVTADAVKSLEWYRRATRTGVVMAPALVGETVFERDPIAGIVWLMLGLERAPEEDEANAVIASSLALHAPRLNDAAIQAAQVWADACRERDGWPDEVTPAHRVTEPFVPRPPTPALPAREPHVHQQLTQRVSFGPWGVLLPPAASVSTVRLGQHLKATWGGAFTQHLVFSTLAPGVDLATSVKRSLSTGAPLWKQVSGPDRFLMRGLDTTSSVFVGQGPVAGQSALKRYVGHGDALVVLTGVAPSERFEDKRWLLEAVADSLQRLP